MFCHAEIVTNPIPRSVSQSVRYIHRALAAVATALHCGRSCAIVNDIVSVRDMPVSTPGGSSLSTWAPPRRVGRINWSWKKFVQFRVQLFFKSYSVHIRTQIVDRAVHSAVVDDWEYSRRILDASVCAGADRGVWVVTNQPTHQPMTSHKPGGKHCSHSVPRTHALGPHGYHPLCQQRVQGRYTRRRIYPRSRARLPNRA